MRAYFGPDSMQTSNFTKIFVFVSGKHQPQKEQLKEKEVALASTAQNQQTDCVQL